MRIFALTLTDGTMGLMRTYNDPGDAAPEIAKWDAESQARVVSIREIAPADLPDNPPFRWAYHDTGSAIEINMPKARDLSRGRIRAARKPFFEDLDRQYFKADEDGDNTAKGRIKTKKDKLRDGPSDNRLDNAPNPTALKNAEDAIIGAFET